MQRDMVALDTRGYGPVVCPGCDEELEDVRLIGDLKAAQAAADAAADEDDTVTVECACPKCGATLNLIPDYFLPD